MSRTVADHLSIKTTRFFMQIVGMWEVESKREKIISNFLLTSIVANLIFGANVLGLELQNSWGDLAAITYNVPCLTTTLQELSKLAVFIYNRRKVKDLNTFTENMFINVKYDRFDLDILEDCNRTCLWAYAISFILMQTITWYYMSIPLIEKVSTRNHWLLCFVYIWGLSENLERNQTERELPFRIAIDLPLAETPWFEIVFALEAMSTCSIGICATTFAGFLFTINTYAAGQFKILRRKIKISSDTYPDNLRNRTQDFISKMENAARDNLRKCVLQHQLLIGYIERVENLFCYIMLGQALCGVSQICFSAFQIVLGADISLQRTGLSVIFLIGNIIQLFLFCWSSHIITEQSLAVAEAAYKSSWYNMPCQKNGRTYRTAILIMICRARRPCILTVGKFTPMSLNTFASVFNTSISYFTVLRQMREDQS